MFLPCYHSWYITSCDKSTLNKALSDYLLSHHLRLYGLWRGLLLAPRQPPWRRGSRQLCRNPLKNWCKPDLHERKRRFRRTPDQRPEEPSSSTSTWLTSAAPTRRQNLLHHQTTNIDSQKKTKSVYKTTKNVFEQFWTRKFVLWESALPTLKSRSGIRYGSHKDGRLTKNIRTQVKVRSRSPGRQLPVWSPRGASLFANRYPNVSVNEWVCVYLKFC